MLYKKKKNSTHKLLQNTYSVLLPSSLAHKQLVLPFWFAGRSILSLRSLLPILQMSSLLPAIEDLNTICFPAPKALLHWPSRLYGTLLPPHLITFFHHNKIYHRHSYQMNLSNYGALSHINNEIKFNTSFVQLFLQGSAPSTGPRRPNKHL